MFSDADLETCLYRFYNTINRITEKFVPKVSTRPKSFPVWFTHELRSLVSSKKAAHAQWKCSGSLGDQIEFKRLRAACIRLSRTSYRDYVADVEANSARNPKYWVNATAKLRRQTKWVSRKPTEPDLLPSGTPKSLAALSPTSVAEAESSPITSLRVEKITDAKSASTHMSSYSSTMATLIPNNDSSALAEVNACRASLQLCVSKFCA